MNSSILDTFTAYLLVCQEKLLVTPLLVQSFNLRVQVDFDSLLSLSL